MNQRIGIIDYGAGNLMSVANALKYLGIDSVISREKSVLEDCSKLILPGVGAFPYAMDSLENAGLTDFIKQQAEKKPLLSICLGMQMLFDCGEELEHREGLGLIPGYVDKIPTNLKLPAIGWNSLSFKNDCPMLRDIDDGAYVYFVHSFCGHVKEREHLAASTDYGCEVTALVWRDYVYGAQFHPEKSGETGLKMLKNFWELSD